MALTNAQTEDASLGEPGSSARIERLAERIRGRLARMQKILKGEDPDSA